MKQYLLLIIISFVLSAFSSCSSGSEDTDTPIGTNQSVQISTRISTLGGSGRPEDNKYDNLTAYLFVNKVFTEKKVVSGSDLSLMMDKTKDNKVFFVANTEQFKELSSLKVGSSDFSIFSSAKTQAYTAEAGAKMFMVANMEINPTDTKRDIDLVRGVARLDITLPSTGYSIVAVRVKNTAAESLLLPGTLSNPATTLYAKTLPTPSAVSLLGVFYLYEHTKLANCTVEIDVLNDGKPITVKATLPETIIRNMAYEVEVDTKLGQLDCKINISDWGVGGVVEAVPDSGAAILLNPVTTQLPDTVVADYTSSIITVPGGGSKFTIGLKSDFDIEVLPQGNAPSIRITPIAGDKNRFQVTVDPQPWNSDAYTAHYSLKNKSLENVYDHLAIQVKNKLYDIPTVQLGGVEWMAFNSLGKDGLEQTRAGAKSIEEVYQTRFADALGYYVHWGRPHVFKPWENTAPSLIGTANPWTTEESVPCPPRFRVASMNDFKKILPSGTAVPSTYTISGKQFQTSIISHTPQALLPNGAKVDVRYLMIEEIGTGRKLFFPFSGNKGDKASGTGWNIGTQMWVWGAELSSIGGHGQVLQVLTGATPKANYATLPADGFAPVRCVKK